MQTIEREPPSLKSYPDDRQPGGDVFGRNFKEVRSYLCWCDIVLSLYHTHTQPCWPARSVVTHSTVIQKKWNITKWIRRQVLSVEYRLLLMIVAHITTACGE